MISRIITVSTVVCALLAAPAAARAQASLDHANPLVGSTVSSPPQEVTLSFTQKLEPAFSAVQVTDDGGNRVDQGHAQVSGSTMRVGLKAIGPGTYHVSWQALSVDTHKTEGSFSFTVTGGR
jgi:methionine-rich copper-binding protein CopC